MIVLWLLSLVAEAGGKDHVQILLSTQGDDISFDKREIEASVDRPLAIQFTNRASRDSAIVHNTVVLQPGTEEIVFAKLAEVDYELAKLAGHPAILALGAPLQPGQSETLVIKFPAAGTYPFVCLMPGHGDMMGMKGVILVKP
jgi:plastocyanin